MAENKKKKIHKKSFARKVFIVCFIQAFLLGTVLTVYGGNLIVKGIKKQAMEDLQSVAKSIETAYEEIAPGDYSLNDAGQLMKGEVNMLDKIALLDQFGKAAGKDVTFFYGDTRMITTLVNKDTGERIIGTKSSAKVASQVLDKGEAYSDYELVINGEDYFAYYLPLKNADGQVVGMLFVGKVVTEVHKEVNAQIYSMAGCSIVMFIICMLIIFYFVKRVAKDLTETENALSELEQGNLNLTFNDRIKNRGDEIGSILLAVESLTTRFNRVIKSLNSTVKMLIADGNNLEQLTSHSGKTAEDISLAIEEISKGAITQATDVETATQSTANMGELISDIANDLNALQRISSEMQGAQTEATQNMQQLTEVNDKTTKAISKIATNIRKTDASVQMIGEAVNLITNIADETNLLSINASIEAARAGEAGKGFSVVAMQIQKLAEESNSSAKRIEEVIATLSQDSAASITIMEEVSGNIHEQEVRLADTLKKIEKANDGVKETAANIEKINGQAEECNSSREQVIDIIQNLSALSQENAASTEETTASMEELTATINVVAESAKKMQDVAQSLNNEVGYFKI
ncbi:methyl-accepting chemotaxis protein [Anaerosporobacter faecicola]|uniref:methyl-accepting chemotaxis protein n=1 Tax=Anaerosporobacter faecicola TaxID=2718714 RepID=UPI0014399CE1|nr:methyl-accepting chemotaxis protein [Anaerosporobacter faecicola]